MDSSTTFSLKYQARALCAQSTGGGARSRWAVGTNTLREDNELRVLEYDEVQEVLQTAAVYAHPEEIWDIACSPTSSGTFVTVHSKGGVYNCSIWRAQAGGSTLQRQAELNGHQGVIRRALWHPHQSDTLLTVEEGALRKWSIGDQAAQQVGSLSPGELQQLWSGAMHPKNPGLAATAGGNNVQIWDLKSMSKVGEIPGAHRMPVRDVDFAAGQEHRIVSAGDDCKLRFWELRMLGKSEALLELGGHSHWVWKVQFNPTHSQLLASSSSDSLVNLWHTPILAKGGDSTPKATPLSPSSRESDGKVHSYDDHEDSVYGLAWSASDPWLFASLSYDGRIVVNKVPKNVKYKVLI